MISGQQKTLRFFVVWLLTALSTQACTPQTTDEFEILVWTSGPFSEEDFYPDGDVIDGPCGPMRTLMASSLRELARDEYDSLERVLEFSDSGAVIGEWRVPVESTVMGVEDNWLTVSTSDGYLAINQQGELNRADQTDLREDMEYFGDCPDPVLAEFLGPNGASDYLACWTLNDRGSGKTRLLAYQGVCT